MTVFSNNLSSSKRGLIAVFTSMVIVNLVYSLIGTDKLSIFTFKSGVGVQ